MKSLEQSRAVKEPERSSHDVLREEVTGEKMERLRGGTKEDAQNYLKTLNEIQNRQRLAFVGAYGQYNSQGDSNATGRAKSEHPEGYVYNNEYQRQKSRKASREVTQVSRSEGEEKVGSPQQQQGIRRSDFLGPHANDSRSWDQWQKQTYPDSDDE